MKFENVLLRDIDKNKIILGYNDNLDLYFDIKKNNSIIITGSTGSGKSTILDEIILQLVNKYNSNSLGIASIDTGGVELRYLENSSYSLFSAYNDINKSVVVLSRILKEIDRRKELLRSFQCLSVDEYNKKNIKKLPFILLAIEDSKDLLKVEDLDNMLKSIISAKNLNILTVIISSNIYNKFFITDDNLLADMLISFDFTSKEEESIINIEGASNLLLNQFKVRYKDNYEIYNSYIFNDDLLTSRFND